MFPPNVNLTVLVLDYQCHVTVQTQIEIQKALKEDPTVYEYDAVYEEMEEKKKAASFKVPKKDKKVQNVHMYNS